VTRIGAAMTKLHLKDAIFAVGKADLLGQNACDVVMAFNRFFLLRCERKTLHASGTGRGDRGAAGQCLRNRGSGKRSSDTFKSTRVK
jgi:hypothetical protein